MIFAAVVCCSASIIDGTLSGDTSVVTGMRRAMAIHASMSPLTDPSTNPRTLSAKPSTREFSLPS